MVTISSRNDWRERSEPHPIFFGAAIVFAVLAGLCAAAALFALAQLSWWSPVFLILSGLCFECFLEASGER